MKRFYKQVEIAPVDDQPGDKGWCILLDGRKVKTPAKAALVVPTEALATALAEEWRDQGEVIDIQGMHLTRLINVVIDRTPQTRGEMVDEVAKYCETDLVCFLAEGPPDLTDRQIALWRPVREWLGKTHNIVLLEVPGGLLAAPQPPASLQAARDYADGLDNWRLTGLVFGLGLFGSAVLAIAVCAGHLTGVEAYERSVLDELWQNEIWGTDDENEARHAINRAQAQALSKLFSTI